MTRFTKIFAEITLVLALVVGLYAGYEEAQQRWFPLEYEIIGVCSSTQLNRYGLVMSEEAYSIEAVKFKYGKKVPLLLDHKSLTSHVVGVVDKIEVGKGQIFFRAKIKKTDQNAEIVDKLLNKEIDSVSIGFIQKRVVNRVILDIDLLEISLVSVPADTGAKILKVRLAND
jgi:HK97 family phage prohead protease